MSSIAEIEQQMAQMAEMMRKMEANLEAARAAAAVKEKVDAVEARCAAAAKDSKETKKTVEEAKKTVEEAKKAVEDATGGRWKRKGMGGSSEGTESSSSSSAAVATNYHPMPHNPKKAVPPRSTASSSSGAASSSSAPATSTIGTKKVVPPRTAASSSAGKAAVEKEADWLDGWGSESDLGSRSLLSEDEDLGVGGGDVESEAGSRSRLVKDEAEGGDAAAKKKAKKELQKLKRDEAREKERIKKLEERFEAAETSVRLGTFTTIDPKAKAKPQPKRLAHEWKKNPACEQCGKTDHWRKLKAVWTCERKQFTKDDPPDLWSVEYFCIPCIAKEENRPEQEVLVEVLGIPMAAKKWRAGKFAEACEQKRAEFEMADASNHKIRVVVREEFLQELLAPLSEYLFRKGELLEKVCKDVGRHQHLCEALSRCTTLAEEKAIMAEMELLEVDDKYMAYESKGEDQHKWIAAASYSDAWTMIYDKAGVLRGCILSWYVCFGNSRDSGPPQWIKCPCCRVTPSKDWDTLHEDPMAAGQRWYCDPNTCNTRYNAGWGQLVQCNRWNKKENRMDEMYMRAEVPPWDMEDVRAAWTEDNIEAATSMELYERVQRIVPAQSSLVVPDPTLKGQMKLTSKEAFYALPEFSWWEIFGIMGVPAPNGCKDPNAPKVGKSRKRR